MITFFKWLIKLVTASNGLAEQLQKAYQARLEAGTKEQVLQADLTIRQLENAVLMAQIANQDRWSATSIGRYLVVVPFGMWYAATLIDSTYGLPWNTLKLPPEIMELTIWLVPSIIAGDVGRAFFSRLQPKRK